MGLKAQPQHGVHETDPDLRVSTLIGRARDTLAGLTHVEEGVVRDALNGLAWAGQWLDRPYVATPVAPAVQREAREGITALRGLASDMEQLIEGFEDEDPLCHALRVQAGSLAFAILGATASLIERRTARTEPADATTRDRTSWRAIAVKTSF